jgi:hypothetical protein
MKGWPGWTSVEMPLELEKEELKGNIDTAGDKVWLIY